MGFNSNTNAYPFWLVNCGFIKSTPCFLSVSMTLKWKLYMSTTPLHKPFPILGLATRQHFFLPSNFTLKSYLTTHNICSWIIHVGNFANIESTVFRVFERCATEIVKYNKHLQSISSKLQSKVILNCKELKKSKESLSCTIWSISFCNTLVRPQLCYQFLTWMVALGAKRMQKSSFSVGTPVIVSLIKWWVNEA